MAQQNRGRGRQRGGNQPPRPQLRLEVSRTVRSGGFWCIETSAVVSTGKNPGYGEVQFKLNDLDYDSPVLADVGGRALMGFDFLPSGHYKIEAVPIPISGQTSAAGKSLHVHLGEPEMELTASEPTRIHGSWRSVVSTNVFVPGEKRIQVGAEEVEIFLDGQFQGTFITNSAGAIVATDFTNLSPGDHTFEARLRNGRRHQTVIHVPETELELQVTEPVKLSSGWQVKATVTVAIPGERTIISLEPIQFLLDGNPMGIVTTNHAGLALYEFPNLSGGDHVIEATILANGKCCQRKIAVPKSKPAKTNISKVRAGNDSSVIVTVLAEDETPVADAEVTVQNTATGASTKLTTDQFGVCRYDCVISHREDEQTLRITAKGMPKTDLVTLYYS